MNKHAPLREYRVKNRTNPWITRLIIMYQHDIHHKCAAKLKSADLFSQYCSVRKRVVSKIRKAKSRYYANDISTSKAPSHMWKTLRQALGAKSSGGIAQNSPDSRKFKFFTRPGPKFHKTFLLILICTVPYLNVFTHSTILKLTRKLSWAT